MAPSKMFTVALVGMLLLGVQAVDPPSDSESESPLLVVIPASDSESVSPAQAAIPASDSESVSPAQPGPALASDSESSSPAGGPNPPPGAPASDSESESPAALPPADSPVATASPSVSPLAQVDLPGTLVNSIPIGGGTGFGESQVWFVPTLDVATPLNFLVDCSTLQSGTVPLLQYGSSVGPTTDPITGQCSTITVNYVNCENFDVPPTPTCQQNGAGAGTASIVIQLRVTPSVSQSEQTTSPSMSPETPSQSASPQTPSPLPSRFKASRKSPNRYSRAISRASKGAQYQSRGAISRMAKNSPNRKPEHDNGGSHNNNGGSHNNGGDEHKNGGRSNKNGGDKKNGGSEDKKKEKKNRGAVDTVSAAAPEYSATSTDSSNSAYYAFLAIIPVAAGLAGFVWWRARSTPMETVELEYIPKV